VTGRRRGIATTRRWPCCGTTPRRRHPMSDFPSTVVDDDGNVHHLLKQPLGRGGQGVVLRTRSPHIAVKLIGAVEDAPAAPEARSAQKLWGQLTKAPGIALSPDAQRHSALRRRLEDVRALPLPRLHLAQPLSMLRDHVGYTMRLLTGMVPMRTLIAEPGTSKLGEFYQSSGGLGRRLELLANTAGLTRAPARRAAGLRRRLAEQRVHLGDGRGERGLADRPRQPRLPFGERARDLHAWLWRTRGRDGTRRSLDPLRLLLLRRPGVLGPHAAAPVPWRLRRGGRLG
jgi:hypothetical protein